jgi:hypothetical protein
LHYELTKLLRSEVIIGSTAFVEDYEQKLSATPKGLSINAALDKARQNSENNATLALLFDELHLVEVCPDAVLTKVGFFKSKADTLEAIIGELNDFVVKGEGEVMLLERVSAALLSLVRACFERGRILLSSQRIEELLVEAYRPGGRGFARSRTDLNAMASFLFRG